MSSHPALTRPAPAAARDGSRLDCGPTVTVKPNSFTIAFGARAVLSFDLEGRLYVAFVDGRTFRRGVSGDLLAKGRYGAGRPDRWSRPCDEDERLAVYRVVHELTAEALGALAVRGTAVVDGDPGVARQLLARAIEWGPERLEAERGRFRAIYRPVGIVPPDRYLAIVMQATEGCAWNRCAFCSFYRTERYRVKSPEEFRDHARAVRRFLGDGLGLRRSIFLGEANALGAPTRRLLNLLAVVREEFPDQRDVHAFMDMFTSVKPVDELAALRSGGLTRVTVGLETACEPLLTFIRKPSSAAAAVRAIERLKAAGINVSLVVLLGLGGVRFFDDHVHETVRLLNTLPLGDGDIVYFSPLVSRSGADYFERARASGLGVLTTDETRLQEAMIRDGLRFSGPPPKLARYDVREFVY